jgi:hypothetical protein
MKRLLFIILIITNIIFSFGQIRDFNNDSGLRSFSYPIIFEDIGYRQSIYRSNDYYNDRIDTIKDFYLFCDSLKSVEIYPHSFVFYHKYIPYMKNLKYALISGYCSKKDYKQFLFSSNIEYLWVDYTSFPLLVDLYQFEKTLKVFKIVQIQNFYGRRRSNYHFNFSEFDSLTFLSFNIAPKNNSYFSITFPPNLYYLEWIVYPAQSNTPIPQSVEIMMLKIRDNVFPSDLYKLQNLKYLSIGNMGDKPILLPDSLPLISSLVTLVIGDFTEQNVKIISQMHQLDTLILHIATNKLPLNISQLQNIKNFQFGKFSDPTIVNQIKSLFPNSVVTVLQ